MSIVVSLINVGVEPFRELPIIITLTAYCIQQAVTALQMA